MKFEYQAMDSQGEIIRGVEEAKNFKEFIAILFHKKLRPFDIRRVSNAGQKAYGELEHLKKLKGKIQGKEEEPEPAAASKPKTRVLPKIDWTYVVYLIVIVALIAVAANQLKVIAE